MTLEDLTPAVREESILNGDEITPATRLEYFLQKAATELPKPAAGDAGKVLAVNEDADGVEWKAPDGGYDAVISLTFDEDGIVDGGEYVSGGYNTIISAITSGKVPNVLVYGDYDEIFFTLMSDVSYYHTIEDDTMIIDDLTVRCFDLIASVNDVATTDGSIITGTTKAIVGTGYVFILGSDNSIVLD